MKLARHLAGRADPRKVLVDEETMKACQNDPSLGFDAAPDLRPSGDRSQPTKCFYVKKASKHHQAPKSSAMAVSSLTPAVPAAAPVAAPSAAPAATPANH